MATGNKWWSVRSNEETISADHNRFPTRIDLELSLLFLYSIVNDLIAL